MVNKIKLYLLMTAVSTLVLTGCDAAIEPPVEEAAVESVEETASAEVDEESTDVKDTVPVEETTESESTEEVAEEGDVTGTQSNNVFNQPLTGDVVEINGMTPAAVLTFIENTPAGEQIKIQLVDANYNTILTGMAFDTEHTKYKYVYLTTLDMSGEMMGSPFFQVAGTDSQMSGNLNNVGSEIYVGE